MPEMHLRQPGFTYSACGPFTKHRERINKFMKTRDTRFIYRHDLDKACFQHELRKKLYATNMSYLILHQMKGYFDNKSPTKKQIHQLYCSLKELLKDKKYSSKSI